MLSCARGKSGLKAPAMEALEPGPQNVVTVEGILGWKPGDLGLNLCSAPNSLGNTLDFLEIKGTLEILVVPA